MIKSGSFSSKVADRPSVKSSKRRISFTILFSPATVYTLIGALVVVAMVAVFFLEGLPYERQVKLHKPSSVL